MNLRMLDYGFYQIYKNLGVFGTFYDTTENDENITFTMSVPGLMEDGIDIRIKESRRLVVKSLKSSKYTPDFNYAFVLPCKVIKKETFANLKDGVLTIVMKKDKPDDYQVRLK